MYKYRNVKTGAIVEVPSKLGGNWELISDGAPKKEPVVSVPVAEVKEEVKPVKKAAKKTSKKTTKK